MKKCITPKHYREMLARGDRSEFRFYNISSMINNDISQP